MLTYPRDFGFANLYNHINQLLKISLSADIENRLVNTGFGEEAEGGTNGERSIATYILHYIKQIVNGNLLYDSGNSNQGSVTT